MVHRMRKSMLGESRSSLMAFLTTVLLVSLGSASAGGKDPLFPGPVRPGNLDYRTELPQAPALFFILKEGNSITSKVSRKPHDFRSR
jgi:hypothetical protein